MCKMETNGLIQQLFICFKKFTGSYVSKSFSYLQKSGFFNKLGDFSIFTLSAFCFC